jgi:hypothetical protein
MLRTTGATVRMHRSLSVALASGRRGAGAGYVQRGHGDKSRGMKAQLQVPQIRVRHPGAVEEVESTRLVLGHVGRPRRFVEEYRSYTQIILVPVSG